MELDFQDTEPEVKEGEVGRKKYKKGKKKKKGGRKKEDSEEKSGKGSGKGIMGIYTHCEKAINHLPDKQAFSTQTWVSYIKVG